MWPFGFPVLRSPAICGTEGGRCGWFHGNSFRLKSRRGSAFALRSPVSAGLLRLLRLFCRRKLALHAKQCVFQPEHQLLPFM